MRGAVLFLLRLLPAAFRARFAAELREHIAEEYAAARSRGLIAAFGYSIITAFDLLRSAVAERWDPSWDHPRVTTTEDFDMRLALGEWTRDVKHAMRTVRRSPGFATISVGTLGLAIGVSAGMFGVVNTVLLEPLPYKDPDALVWIAATAPGSQLPGEFGPGDEFLLQYREGSRLLDDAAMAYSYTSTLRTADRVERVRMASVTTSVFTTLGVQPILGRVTATEDDSASAVISHALWQTWFGGDPAVIGRTVQASGSTVQVIGVMPAEFGYPSEGTLIWLPFTVRPSVTPGQFGGRLIGRMKPGVTTEALASELTTLSKRLPERFGGSAAYAKVIEQHRAVVRPLEQQLLGELQSPLWVLLGAAGIVLIIACANVANLFLVRAEGRHREMAVRTAIGAGRGQLVRLLMAESVVVAVASSAMALAFAAITLPLFVQAAPEGVPRLATVGLDAATVGFTLVAALVAALACGLFPALRSSAPDLTRLREAGRGATRGGHWLRNSLVVGQTALALVLLIGSGLLMRSYGKLNAVDAGYDTKDIFTFQIAPEQPALRSGPSFAQFSHDFMDRMRALPGVQSVGLIENVPLDEGLASLRFRTEAQAGDPEAGTRLFRTFAAGDYFATMGIRVLAGRAFQREDHFSTLGNVVVSKSAADLLWPNEDAVGRRVQQDGRAEWFTVVGVVEDAMQEDWREAGQALVYAAMVAPGPMTASWRLSSPAYVLKTARATTIAPEVRAIVREIAPEAPMYRVWTMEDLTARSMVRLSFTMLTLGIAATLALILGAVGLYGVLSYVVAQRTREIGVRMALGADAGQVRRMVVAQGARVVALGVLIGGVAALGVTRYLGSLLFGVEAIDLATFAGMSAVMVAIGLLACYIPARRASSVDPLEAIRGE